MKNVVGVINRVLIGQFLFFLISGSIYLSILCLGLYITGILMVQACLNIILQIPFG